MHDMHEKRTPGHDESASAAPSPTAMLAQFFAQVEAAVLIADAGRRICFANARALSLFDCEESDMAGRKAGDFFTESRDLPATEPLQASADSGQGYLRYLGRRLRVDGSSFDAHTLIATVRHPIDGDIFYIEVVHEATIWPGSDQVLHALRQVVFDPALPFEQRRRAMLEFGCAHFGLPGGSISRLMGDQLTVIDAFGSPQLNIGDVLDRSETYCDEALERNAPFRRDGLTYKRVAPRRYAGRLDAGCYIGCPIHAGTHCYGTLSFIGGEADGLFSQADLDLIGALAEWVGHEVAIESSVALIAQAREQISATYSEQTDADADTADRGRLMSLLEEQIDRARAQHQPVSVALLAVDQFEKLDEQHGQGSGVAVMEHMAALCNRALRANDRVGRWSDDELLLLLPGTHRAEALLTVERLLDVLRAQNQPGEASHVHFTVSAGVTESTGDDNTQIIIRRAGIARHLARSNGRDRAETG